MVQHAALAPHDHRGRGHRGLPPGARRARPVRRDAGARLAFPERYEGEADRRRKECARLLYDAVGITWGDRRASAEQTAKNFTFFGAPDVAVVTTDGALGPYGALDCGFYVQTFLLAAASLGLGAVPQAALAAHSPFVRAHLGLPADRPVVCGISFGWPNPDHPANDVRPPRQAVAETATWVT